MSITYIPRIKEGPLHHKAKWRLYLIVENTTPKPSVLDTEHEYPNPFGGYEDEYPWKFDVYFEIGKRKVALEVDGKIGHSSVAADKKRRRKVEYLKSQGIELYAWPTKYIIGKKAFPEFVFLEELQLTKDQRDKKWFNR